VKTIDWSALRKDFPIPGQKVHGKGADRGVDGMLYFYDWGAHAPSRVAADAPSAASETIERGAQSNTRGRVRSPKKTEAVSIRVNPWLNFLNGCCN